MMSSYYTPPPSSGSQWSQPLILPPHRPSSATHQQNAQLLPHATPNNNQSPYASMMMQQMLQNYTFNVSHQQQQFTQHPQPQQQHVPTPVFDQPEMRTPQPSDNPLLAQILYEQTKRGLTYKVALESLHGHNGIMAFAWKDYFLENKQTIDALVDNLSRQTPSSSNVSAKQRSSSPVVNNSFRPSPAAERNPTHPRTKSEDQKSRASEERSASIPKKGKSKENTPTRVVTTRKEEANGKSKHKSSETRGDTPSRRTLNSLSSAPSNDLLAKIPPAVAIDESTGLPAAPSRSPSPPPPGPNSRYTEQDAIFFFRRIAYDLARHPELSKAGLCEILGQKVPHHSALSWRTYWHRHDDVADKMYLLTQLDEADREAAIQSWKGTTSVKAVNPRSRAAAAAARRVSYKESSDSESGEASNSDSSSSKSEDESSGTSDEGDDSDAQGSTDEEGQLGEAGSMFSIVEKRVLAKHIASSPEWFDGRREWESFFAAYPQRTQASWREYYRRKGDEIDALAKKYMRKAKKASRTSISAQRGRPSWARRNTSAAAIDGTGPIKRKLVEGDSREQSEEKRTKMEDI
ncbi:hypothetical protein ACEPAI_838 [Sanghuangporus weigelae]